MVGRGLKNGFGRGSKPGCPNDVWPLHETLVQVLAPAQGLVLRRRQWKSPRVNTDTFYHYCIVRRDLPLGVICAQLVHAAGASSPGNIPSDTHAVVLAVADENELLELEQALFVAGISVHPVREPDAPYNGALMAIGIPPQPRTHIRNYLRHLPLLR